MPPSTPRMPELPEVEFGRKVAEEQAVGKVITKVVVADDPIVFVKKSPRWIKQRLVGRRVIAAHRRGKYIFFELDERPWPLFHFGMTGAFRGRDSKVLRLASGIRDQDGQWPPRFAKIQLTFEDGAELVMTNARRLGRIRVQTDPLAEAPLAKLGFDPLLEMPGPKPFRERLEGRNAVLKSLLLNQSFAAGVGNWIADEVLYQARIDPRRSAASLSAAEAELLRRKLKSIIRTAVSVDADKSRLPKSWLFHRRWGKKEGATSADGDVIEHLEIGGRTTAWVPAVQK